MTSRAIWASWVSAPTRVARTTSRPPTLTHPPVTVSPGPTSTGTGSPVSMEVSTADRPAMTTPSVAIFSPGRITNSSPTTSVSGGDGDLAAVAEHRRLLGAQVEQRRQRGAGLAPRPRFQVPAEQDQRGDADRDLQVGGVRPAALVPPAIHEKVIRSPMRPAPPKTSAYSDQR